MRPLYPLSLTRMVPAHISRPDYAENGKCTVYNIIMLCKPYAGIPQLERCMMGQPPRVLSLEEQDKMRKVCKAS